MPVAAKNTSILVNQFDLSGFFNNADVSGEVEMIETTTFQASSKTYIAGLRDGKASLGGFWNANPLAATPNAVDDVLAGLLSPTAPQAIVSIAPAGWNTVGLPASVFKTFTQKYSVTSPFNGVVSCMAELQGDGGIYAGVVLASLSARTATANGTAVDNLAATTNGALVNFHLLNITGGVASLTVIVEDSADGAAWATIGTFNAATIAGVQQLAIAGTVRRHTRVRWTMSGSTPSATFAVALARK